MITKITLLNFRKFKRRNFNINNQFVIITGDNAVGKTTILEAVYLASVTKSLRTNNIEELINIEEEQSLVEVVSENKKYKIFFKEKTKTVSIDTKEIKKISDYIGNLPAVFFTPSELSLITGSPLNRRLFFNIELSQLYPEYVIYLSKYNSILKERNAYLKSRKVDNTYLTVLTENLCKEAVEIIKIRNNFLKEINSIINSIHREFSNDEKIELIYLNSLPFENPLEYLLDKQKKDIQFETTSYGIHRDDILINLNDKDAKIFASQGQKRSIVLSLKITLVLLIQKYKRKYPILLLDDVLSELDVNRQNNLLRIILNLGQTFITGTNIDLNDLDTLNNYQVIKLD